jgi:hypothetical protein
MIVRKNLYWHSIVMFLLVRTTEINKKTIFTIVFIKHVW